MDVSGINENPLYKEFKTELKICKIGGLFLALYRDKKTIDVIINQLEKDLPDYFVFKLQMDAQKVGFPTFFEQTFAQTGKKSNIFHVIGIETLPDELRSNFMDYLQYTRERFKAKPYSIVFWITPQSEKQLFFSAPDFHHWISGTYDFCEIPGLLEESDDSEEVHAVSLENAAKFLKRTVWQYESWQEVKDKKEEFLIDVMERANLHEYYVASYCIDKEGKEFLLDDLFEEFLSDKKKNFLTLLGDFGTGKTSFSLHYYIYMAKHFLKDKTKRIPIFISLRNYRGKLNIETFMVKEFYEKFNIKLSFTVFQQLALQGKFVFFVDGFDEMASLADKELTIQNLKELTKLSFENILFMTKKQSESQKANKVFLTCRTHYFLTEIQEKEVLKADYTVLYRNYATKSNYEITRIKLREFNDEQIEEYIWKNTRDKKKSNEYMGIIKSTYNLEELSTRPILLDMIIKTLPGLKDKKKINASHLYKAYTDIWIKREDWRSQMTEDGKRRFMWELALKMFKEGGDFTVHYSKLNKPQKTHLKENFEMLEDDYYRYETTTCCFLNRDQEGNYKFIHKSFMEYFLAEYFFHRIKNRKKRIIQPDQLNKETEYFLKLIISSEKSDLQNLDLSYLNLKSIDLETANLNGADFRWADLCTADLRNANLERVNFNKADLTEANLQGARINVTNLREAKLNRVILQGFDLKKADLHGFEFQGANFQEANLREANLQGANLYGANLNRANLRLANLQKANLSKAILQRADLKGAILQRADLWMSDLRKASLLQANIYDTNLQGVDLLGAKNITLGMLSEVWSLFQAKGLDPKIEKRLRESRPGLFDDPRRKK